MPKPVCVKCQCFYRPEKNGFTITEMMPDKRGQYAIAYDGNIRGIRHPECWSPYKIWRGDKWKCPDCEHEIVVGFAPQSLDHYMPGFEEDRKNSELDVNDC